MRSNTDTDQKFRGIRDFFRSSKVVVLKYRASDTVQNITTPTDIQVSQATDTLRSWNNEMVRPSIRTRVRTARVSKLEEYKHIDGPMEQFPAHLKEQISRHIQQAKTAPNSLKRDFEAKKWAEPAPLQDRSFYMIKNNRKLKVSRFKYGTGNTQILVAELNPPTQKSPTMEAPKSFIIVRHNNNWSYAGERGKPETRLRISYRIWEPFGDREKQGSTGSTTARPDPTVYCFKKQIPLETGTPKVLVRAENSRKVFLSRSAEKISTHAEADSSEEQNRSNQGGEIATSLPQKDGQKTSPEKQEELTTTMGKVPDGTTTTNDTNKVPHTVERAKSIKVEQQLEQGSFDHPILVEDIHTTHSVHTRASEPSQSSRKRKRAGYSPQRSTSALRTDPDHTYLFAKKVRVHFKDHGGHLKRDLPFFECSTSQDLRRAALAADPDNFECKTFRVRVGEDGKDSFPRKGNDEDYELWIEKPLRAIFAAQVTPTGDDMNETPLIITVIGCRDEIL